jgi:hypothetical protein
MTDSTLSECLNDSNCVPGAGGIATYVMNMTSFNLGPGNWKGVPEINSPET